MLRGYARKNGFTVEKEFVDNETASSTGRTGFNSMLGLLGKNKGCRVILVEKTDRLTRNMTDYLSLDIEKTGIEIHFVREGKVLSKNSSPTDFFMQDIEIAQAAYLSRNISSEARKGMKAKAESGWYPSVAPLGYLNTKNAAGVKVITLDPKTHGAIRRMFHRYSTGKISLQAIVGELFRSGVRSKRGKKIGLSTIHKMLRNPIYKGMFYWNGVLYEGKHPALVSAELWYKVQDVLEGRGVAKPKKRDLFAYSGLMKCGKCGCAITAERQKGKYNYYRCTGHRGRHGDPYVREEKLDMQFIRILKGLHVEDRIANWILSCVASHTEDRERILDETRENMTKQLRRLKRRSEVLYDDRLDGRIDVETYDRKSADIRRETEILSERLDNLELGSQTDALAHARGIFELTQKAHRHFVIAPATEKRQFLQKLFSNCTLESGVVYPAFQYPLGVLYDTNTKWKESGAVSTDKCALLSVWHPETNSNRL